MAAFDSDDLWSSDWVVESLQNLFEHSCKLITGLYIPFSAHYGPFCQTRLIKHLHLDFSIKVLGFLKMVSNIGA